MEVAPFVAPAALALVALCVLAAFVAPVAAFTAPLLAPAALDEAAWLTACCSSFGKLASTFVAVASSCTRLRCNSFMTLL